MPLADEGEVLGGLTRAVRDPHQAGGSWSPAPRRGCRRIHPRDIRLVEHVHLEGDLVRARCPQAAISANSTGCRSDAGVLTRSRVKCTCGGDGEGVVDGGLDRLVFALGVSSRNCSTPGLWSCWDATR